MGAVDIIVSSIKHEIAEYPTDDLGAVVFHAKNREGVSLDDIIRNALPLDELLHPEPDVELENEIRDESNVLGTYTRMQSPGIITLRQRAINNFFWSVVREFRHRNFDAFLTAPDLERIAILVTKKTYHHEVFHFNSDVMGMLFGSQYDAEIEEALAVAYSRLMVAAERANANSQLGRTNAVLFNYAFDRIYRYTSPGYRDWVNFADEVRFKNGLVDYIKPGQYQRLQGNGVAVEDLIFEMLGRAKQAIEKVI